MALVISGHKLGKRHASDQSNLDESSRVDEELSAASFQPGEINSFFIQSSDLGAIDSIAVIARGKGQWKLESIELVDTVRATSYNFSCYGTFALESDTSLVEKTFKPQRVLHQSSLLQTSSGDKAAAAAAAKRTDVCEQMQKKTSRRMPQLSVWSPQTPGGYVKLGDVLSSPGEPPATSAVAAASINSGLVAYPKAFELVWWEGPLLSLSSNDGDDDDMEEEEVEMEEGLLVIWRPIPPDGYRSIGCVASCSQPDSQLDRSDVDQSDTVAHDSISPSHLTVLHKMDGLGRRHKLIPPPLDSVGCIHSHVLVESSVGQCYSLPSLKAKNDERRPSSVIEGGRTMGRAWTVQNAAGSFQVSMPSSSCSFLDLRSPLGVPPAALDEHTTRTDRNSTFLASKSSQDLFLSHRSKFITAVASQRSVANAIEFTRIWWDRNDPSSASASSSYVKVGFWRPLPPPGYVSLGDYMVTGIYAPPRSALVIRQVPISVHISSESHPS